MAPQENEFHTLHQYARDNYKTQQTIVIVLLIVIATQVLGLILTKLLLDHLQQVQGAMDMIQIPLRHQYI